MANRSRRILLSCMGAAALMLASPGARSAEPAWPARPITIVVPFPAGGGPDLVARVLAAHLGGKLGQPVIVDNKPGASGLLGAGQVARSLPDGYTLLLTPNTLVIAPHVMAKGASGTLDVQRDLQPIVEPATTAMVLVASPSLGVHDLKQLVALVKKNPGLAYASTGPGSLMHFGGAMLARSAGIDLLHVPYKGAAPAMQALLGGEVKLGFVGMGAATSLLKSGKLVALATAEKTRSPLAPDVPTAAEQGVAHVDLNTWFGLFAPAGTPPRIVERINRETNQVLQLPEVREKLREAGMEAVGGSAQMLGDLVRSDDQRYGRVARELDIRAE